MQDYQRYIESEEEDVKQELINNIKQGRSSKRRQELRNKLREDFDWTIDEINNFIESV